MKTARETAGKVGLPLMVHIGDPHRQVPPSLTGEMLPLLRQGDILSHIYTGQSGALLGEDGRIHPELAAARDRGVVLDVSPGIKNFTFSTARKMMDQGIFPTTVSTDISRPSVTAYAFGLTVAMSKFLEMRLPLEDIIAMTTIHPARAAGISDRKGSLKPTMDADISILEIRPGRWRFQDVSSGTLSALADERGHSRSAAWHRLDQSIGWDARNAHQKGYPKTRLHYDPDAPNQGFERDLKTVDKLEKAPLREPLILVPLARVERAAHGLGIRCSILLSYRGSGDPLKGWSV